MKFAINYSPEVAELVRKGQIDIDLFKTPPWPQMITDAEMLRPVTVHFNLRAGNTKEPDWREIDRYLARSSTAFVNTHLRIKCSEMPHIPSNKHSDKYQKEEVLERLLNHTIRLTEYFGPDRVIAENIPFRLNENSDLMACAEPEIVSQVVGFTGCGFLLDVSHARIAARALEMDGREYIEALPVQHLRELHFTGIHNWGGYLMDHLSILEEDWPWLDWVLENIQHGNWGKAQMLAFEYGGTGEFFSRFSDPNIMALQVPRLFGLCHNGSTP
jgi:uncharacterized protein (UPF0276 family)